MGTWALEPGERLLSEHEVAVAFEGKTRIGRLYLTTTRAVVAALPRRSWWTNLMGVWAIVFRNLAPGGSMRVLYNMKRDRFASVEPGEGGLIVFHDNGEGYAHVSFAITTNELANTDTVHAWQQRMHAWASGASDGSELPSATIVEK